MTDVSTDSVAADAASTPAGAAVTDAPATTPAGTLLDGGAEQQTDTDKPAEGTNAAAAEAGAEAGTDDGKPEGEGDAPKPKAPEAYADFTLPEGVVVDEALTDEFKTVAKDLDLDQGQAQKLADLGAKQAQRFVERQREALNQASEEWTTATKTDAEIGGDKLNDSLAASQKALKAFGTPELRALLNETRLGNHPEVIRLLARAGKAISDDTFVSGDRNAATPGQGNYAARLYPSSQGA